MAIREGTNHPHYTPVLECLGLEVGNERRFNGRTPAIMIRIPTSTTYGELIAGDVRVVGCSSASNDRTPVTTPEAANRKGKGSMGVHP